MIKTLVDYRNKRNPPIKRRKRVVIETGLVDFSEIVGSNVFGQTACEIDIQL